MNELDLSFIILCPERNLGGLRSTVSSIKNFHSNRHHVCIAPEDTSSDEMQEMLSICPTFKGKGTITSLMNLGVSKCKSQWALIIMAGSWIRAGMPRKYAKFITDERDIMFPIVMKKWNFVDGSINGLLMHKTALKEIGKFKEKGDRFDMCKLMWGLDAMDRGYKFKAIHGIVI